MKKDKKEKKIPSLNEIESDAVKGKNVNQYFSRGKMMPPLLDQVQRVNVDFGVKTLSELDEVATELNVSRQAVIKLYTQRELDQYFLARKARQAVG